MYKINCRQKR